MPFYRCMPPSSGGGGGGGDYGDLVNQYVTINNNGNIEFPPMAFNMGAVDGLFTHATKFNLPVRFGNRAPLYKYAFFNCQNFNSPVTIDPIDVETVYGNNPANHNMYSLWRGFDAMNMFYLCYNFNQPIDLTNLQSIYMFTSMFFGCKNFNQPVNVPTALVHNQYINQQVKGIASMFAACSNLNSRIILENADGGGQTASQLSAARLFQSCYNFNQPFYLVANNFNVVTFDSGFEACNNMRQPVLFELHGIKQWVNFRNVFLNCKCYPPDIIFNFSNVNAFNTVRILNNAYYSSKSPRLNVYTSNVELFKNLPWTETSGGSAFYPTTNGYRGPGTDGNLFLLNNVSDGVNKFWDYYNNFYNIT